MIVTDEAFEELLDRATSYENEGDVEQQEERRRLFAVAVDRAVKKATSHDEGRAWLTHTLKRHGCRLHFLREGSQVFLVACAPLDADEDDDA